MPSILGHIGMPCTLSKRSTGAMAPYNWDVSISVSVSWNPNAETHEVVAGAGGWPRAEIYRTTTTPEVPADLITTITLPRVDGASAQSSPGTYAVANHPVGTVEPMRIKIITKYTYQNVQGQNF